MTVSHHNFYLVSFSLNLPLSTCQHNPILSSALTEKKKKKNRAEKKNPHLNSWMISPHKNTFCLSCLSNSLIFSHWIVAGMRIRSFDFYLTLLLPACSWLVIQQTFKPSSQVISILGKSAMETNISTLTLP